MDMVSRISLILGFKLTSLQDMVFDMEGYHSRSDPRETSDVTTVNGETHDSPPSSSDTTPGPSSKCHH